MVWTNLKLIQRMQADTDCILLKVLSYLTLSPGKLLQNPRKSFSSVAASIPLLLAMVRVSPKLSDNNGLDKHSYYGTLFFYNKVIVVNSCSDIPSSSGEHFF